MCCSSYWIIIYRSYLFTDIKLGWYLLPNHRKFVALQFPHALEFWESLKWAWINRVWFPILLMVSWTRNIIFSLVQVRAWEFDLANRVRPSHLRQPEYSLRPGWNWCLLTRIVSLSAAASIYLFKPQYAIGPVPSKSGYAIAYRRRLLLPRVHRYRPSSPQGCSSNQRVLPFQVLP